jgi:hypothetical protein
VKVKINNNRLVNFANIRVGDFFALFEDGEAIVYRRLPDITVGGHQRNSMRMDEGTFYILGAMQQVVPVNAELVVIF